MSRMAPVAPISQPIRMFAIKFKPVNTAGGQDNQDFNKNKAKFLSFLEKVDEVDKKV